MYHFAASILFYDIAQLRFQPKATWVQQVVSTVFPGAWLRKIRQCFFCFPPVIMTILKVCSLGMYVYMENALLTFSLIHGFRARFPTSFAQHPLASLCASRPIFSSEELFTSVSETCMHHGAIRCHYLISLGTKIHRDVSLWNISVCFDYDIQVFWLTSHRCWADVGGQHQSNVEATLGRHRTADIDPTSVKRRPNTCSLVVLFSLQYGYRPTVH